MATMQHDPRDQEIALLRRQLAAARRERDAYLDLLAAAYERPPKENPSCPAEPMPR